MIKRILAMGLLLSLVTLLLADEPKPPELSPEEQKLAQQANKLNDEGFKAYEAGRYSDAVAKFRQALEIDQKLYTPSKYPNGHPDLATGHNNLAALLQVMAQYEEALPHGEQALATRQKLFPASTHPDGHPLLALSIDNLGVLLHAMGSDEKALPHFERALAMRRKLYPASKHPDGHPSLAISLDNLGQLLVAMDAFEKGLPHVEQSLAMLRKLYPASKYPDGHLDTAISQQNLGRLLMRIGSYEKALSQFELALAMKQKLFPASEFPDGHPELASTLSVLGGLLLEIGSAAKAAPHFEQALAMRQRLYPAVTYPNGHPDLDANINNLGAALHAAGSPEKALPYFEQGLALSRRLYPASRYPDGHERIATRLNNLGVVWMAMGSYEKALSHFEEALAVCRKLYPESMHPDGHPDLATSINNLGGVLFAMGSYEQALPYFEQTLAIRQPRIRNMLARVSEAEALAFVSAQPGTRDAFLSLTAHLPDKAATAYSAIWISKASITRVLERRHAAARVAGTTHAAKFDDLKGLRRRIDQLLRDRRLPPAERDRLLTRVTDDRDRLERELALAVPTLQRAKELDALGPVALLSLLPEHAVLIDFVRYARTVYDRTKPGQTGETRTPRYAAFVLAKGQPIRRVELGNAKPIDQAVAQWCAAIESRTESTAANELRDLVWRKLAPHLPAETTTLYLALDGDLARLPWAALPVTKDRVLLEDYAIATVPHGPFVLEMFKYPHEYRGADSTLLLGGIDYNSSKWPNLPGTVSEVGALTSLAPKPTTSSRSDATAKRLTELLPHARYAHLATHGYFDAETLVAENERARKAMDSRQMGDDTRQVAARNPLGFVGLVLARGEVFTGLQLVDLSLENLRLVTLSACETGLGELTGGEGVQGLQRAFHLAGCPNVVASLWKVNDAATAALMVKFYHEMWVNKKPPIEALREAQLTIYRRPDLIETLASAERGIKLEQALNAKSDRPAETKGTTPTKLWAAFVLSGVGK